MSTKVSKSKKSVKSSKTSIRSTSAKADAKNTKSTKSSSDIPFKKIHVTSIVIYLLLAVAAVVFMKNTSYQLTIGYLAKDLLLSTKTSTTVLGPAAHAVYDIQIRYAVAAIMVLSAVVPILYLTKLKTSYQNAQTKKVSLWRWIDLGIIMGLIIEVVALLSGLSDIPTLKIVGLLIVVTCLLGWLAEKQVSGKRVPAAFSVSLITGTLPWLIIIPYALATILYGSLAAPWYTYALYVTTIVAAVGITLNQYRQYRQIGKWSDYSYAEHKYLTFGMFGKVAFAVILILGLLK